MKSTGLVHVYYGQGKGKSTAALGLALRALGQGMRVLYVPFLKGRESGECAALERFEACSLLRGKTSTKFTFQMTEEEKEQTRRQLYEQFIGAARAAAGDCDLLILDEVLDACALGMLREKELLALLRGRSEGVELVLTGRAPSAAVLECCDYATEMRMVKHPYDRGVCARRGIEY